MLTNGGERWIRTLDIIASNPLKFGTYFGAVVLQRPRLSALMTLIISDPRCSVFAMQSARDEGSRSGGFRPTEDHLAQRRAFNASRRSFSAASAASC
jgi:hypothetical protein